MKRSFQLVTEGFAPGMGNTAHRAGRVSFQCLWFGEQPIRFAKTLEWQTAAGLIKQMRHKRCTVTVWREETRRLDGNSGPSKLALESRLAWRMTTARVRWWWIKAGLIGWPVFRGFGEAS